VFQTVNAADTARLFQHSKLIHNILPPAGIQNIHMQILSNNDKYTELQLWAI
jgi:hypothetical protein